MEEEEVAVREDRHGLGNVLALAGGVLEGKVLEGDVAGVDIDAGAAGGADRGAGEVPVLLGILAESDEGALRAVAADMEAELVVGDDDLFAVGAGVDVEGRDAAVAVVRAGVDSFLDGHVVAMARRINDDVVAAQVLRDFRKLRPDLFADDLGDLAGAGGNEVRVVVLAGGDHEIGLGGLVAERFDPVEGRGCDVEKGDALFRGDSFHRGGIVGVAVAVELALLEPAAGDRGQEHRGAALFADAVDEGAEILLVGAPGIGIAGGIVLLGVVVTELDEDVVAGLHRFIDLVPQAEVAEALGAAAVLGVVDDRDGGGIEEVLEHHAPAALEAGLREVLFGAGAVAHQVDGEGAGGEPDGKEEADSSTSSE